MFKLLLKNPKRIVRNLTIIFVGYIVAAAAFILAALFVPKEQAAKLPLFASIAITAVGLLIVMFLVIAVIGHFANKKDSELRRRYKQEVNSLDASVLASASGISKNPGVINTTRNVKEIKAELVDLQAELYHAQERDKNLKLAKKF